MVAEMESKSAAGKANVLLCVIAPAHKTNSNHMFTL